MYGFCYVTNHTPQHQPVSLKVKGSVIPRSRLFFVWKHFCLGWIKVDWFKMFLEHLVKALRAVSHQRWSAFRIKPSSVSSQLSSKIVLALVIPEELPIAFDSRLIVIFRRQWIVPHSNCFAGPDLSPQSCYLHLDLSILFIVWVYVWQEGYPLDPLACKTHWALKPSQRALYYNKSQYYIRWIHVHLNSSLKLAPRRTKIVSNIDSSAWKHRKESLCRILQCDNCIIDYYFRQQQTLETTLCQNQINTSIIWSIRQVLHHLHSGMQIRVDNVLGEIIMIVHYE